MPGKIAFAAETRHHVLKSASSRTEPQRIETDLSSFLRTNDERERQTNYRALTFAFTGTLLLSATIGFVQAFGLHAVSWLGIPPLMIILWSIGLILCSWRYR